MTFGNPVVPPARKAAPSATVKFFPAARVTANPPLLSVPLATDRFPVTLALVIAAFAVTPAVLLMTTLLKLSALTPRVWAAVPSKLMVEFEPAMRTPALRNGLPAALTETVSGLEKASVNWRVFRSMASRLKSPVPSRSSCAPAGS